LELTGIEPPARLDGRSFAPLLRGQEQANRDFVVKEYNENAGGSRDPMRAIQTRQHLYIFNPWSNGTRIMATATTGTPTYRRLAALARTDDKLAARHKLYQYRVVEELYDVERDPDCLHNLIDSPAHREVLVSLQATLEQWMKQTGDGMLTVFQQRDDAAAREAYVAAQEKEAEARKASGTGKTKGKAGKRKAAQTDGKAQARPRRQTGLIQFVLPEKVTPGQNVTLRIKHQLPADLGEQVLTVTLKGGPDGRGSDAKRLDRQTVKASGSGTAEVTFAIPRDVPGGVVSFAAFVGTDFPTSLEHIQSTPQPAR
jgi:N-sulfoglucosamine sulfohydrolase